MFHMSHDGHTTDWHDSAAPGSTSSSLLGRVKAGESDAWERLVELYGPTVYRWCRQCGVAAGDAADVCQEVFSSMASHVGRFRREKPGDSFRGWLWTITRNKAQDHFRRRAGEPNAHGGSQHRDFLAGLPAATSDLSGSSEPPADRALVRRAMETVRTGGRARQLAGVLADDRGRADVRRSCPGAGAYTQCGPTS